MDSEIGCPTDAVDSMIANLHEKTGKTLEDWVKLAAATGKAKHGEIVAIDLLHHLIAILEDVGATTVREQVR